MVETDTRLFKTLRYTVSPKIIYALNGNCDTVVLNLYMLLNNVMLSV